MQRKLVPDVIKECHCTSITGDKTVLDAAQIMTEENIGALIVVSGKSIEGIITERDMMRKIVAEQRDPSTVKVKEIMTANPDTVGPDCTASQALNMMSSKRYRHLPIVNEEMEPIGMVSVRDLYEAVQTGLVEDLQTVEMYVQGGETYGGGQVGRS